MPSDQSFNVVAAVMAGAFPTLAPLARRDRRDGFERRDERTQMIRWPEVDRRGGPRRADEILAARVSDHLECL